MLQVAFGTWSPISTKAWHCTLSLPSRPTRHLAQPAAVQCVSVLWVQGLKIQHPTWAWPNLLMQILFSKNSRIIAIRRLATTLNSFHYNRTIDIFMSFTQQKRNPSASTKPGLSWPHTCCRDGECARKRKAEPGAYSPRVETMRWRW